MFSKKIIVWYLRNKRDLPRRNTRNPYKIWLSEIILQQTRVEQGLPYYLKFVENFPTVEDLANAHEDYVMKLWQGLGYYSRARNLQHAAQTIVNEHQGKFPKDFESIKKLKGVGEYTASAIASFAYDLPYPVLDGNVYRIISRIFGIYEAIDSNEGKKIFMKQLNELMDRSDAANFNQAIMEFGAIQCVPKNPNCNVCIFKDTCHAFLQNKIEQLPFKEKKIVKKDRTFHFMIFTDGKKFIVQKRNEKDIWQGMYEFPSSEKRLRDNKNIVHQTELQKHLLTHQNIYYDFTLIYQKKLEKENQQLLVNYEEILKLAFPKIMHDYITKKLNLYLPQTLKKNNGRSK